MTDSEHPPSPTHCISCGSEVPDHAKFCQACGSAVYQPEDTSKPPEPAPAEPVSPASKTGFDFTDEAAAQQSSEKNVSQGKGSRFDFAAAKPFLLLISAAVLITVMYFLISPYQNCLRSMPSASSFPVRDYVRELCAERHSW